MKGISSYELIIIFGVVILLVGMYSITALDQINKTILSTKVRIIGDYLGSKAITHSHCYYSKVDKIIINESTKTIIVYMESLGDCNINEKTFLKLLNRSDYKILIK